MGVREERLMAELEAMQNFGSDLLQWETVGRHLPPDHYRFHYHLTSISRLDQYGNPQIIRNVWTVEVKMPSNYPWGKPEARFVGEAILHPNVYLNGDVCIEDRYQQGIGIPLDRLCEHIGQIIAYQKYNLASPANRNERLFQWILANAGHSLPTDARDIRRARISFGNANGGQSQPPSSRIRFGS